VLRLASRYLVLLTTALFVVLASTPCAGSTEDDDASLRVTISELAHDDSAVRAEALDRLTELTDSRIGAILVHYKESSLFLWQEGLVLCPKMEKDAAGKSIAPLLDVLTGDPITAEDGSPRVVPKSELTDVFVRRPHLRALQNAIRVHELFTDDLGKRLSAVQRLGMSNNTDFIEPLERVLKADNPARVHYAAEEGIAILRLSDSEGDRASWIAAARELARLYSARGATRLVDKVKEIDQLQVDEESADLQLRDIYQRQVMSIKTYQDRVGIVKNIFNGISTGSVLVLIALGLAIIFGQMGVINMAHGELVMLGAYATYVTQLMCGHTPEDPNNWFFVAALPVSFIVGALAGLLIEFLVVRPLYKRPLESLLATWGVGLILIQFVRAGFPWRGAEWAAGLPGFLRWGGFGDNIGVNSPTWLVGAVSPVTDLALPYNRLFIIALTIVSVLAIAVMETAASLGVNTRRTDSATFAIGSGLAGIAGYALTTIAGVTPDMGQNYIVDSFLVVVTGGVGKLAGAVSAGTGIGVVNKFFEPISFGGALFSVGLFILVASWIMIGIRARRLERKQLLPALAFPPLYVFNNWKQRGMVKLLVLACAGVVIMLSVSWSSFDHMVVYRTGDSFAEGHRILVADQEGTRKVIQVEPFLSTEQSRKNVKQGLKMLGGTLEDEENKPRKKDVQELLGLMTEPLVRSINESGLRGVSAVSDLDRVILRGSTEVVFASGQESLGLARKTSEGFRAKPTQVATRLPGFGSFLAIPVQTIWGKVLVLVVVMMFIQWQPAGLFPPRGRLADE